MNHFWPYTWRDFFPGYAVPKSILELVTRGEAEDRTDGNDSLPRFTRTVGTTSIDIFADHRDPLRRAFGPDTTRYFVTVDGDVIHESNDASMAVAAFRSAVQRESDWAARPRPKHRARG